MSELSGSGGVTERCEDERWGDSEEHRMESWRSEKSLHLGDILEDRRCGW